MTAKPGIEDIEDGAPLDAFAAVFVSCLVINKAGQILLQMRPLTWHRFPGVLSLFGGQVDEGETPLEALVRELKEELGASVQPKEPVFLGSMTESETGYTELVHTFFWRDTTGTITGCYEGEARTFPRKEDALAHTEVMEEVRWIIARAEARGLLTGNEVVAVDLAR